MNECPFHEGDSVVLYARDSGGVGQELSIAQQEEVAQKYCQENKLELVEIFADAARSGASEVGRDQFARMMAYLEENKVAGVIFWSYSRLSRDFDDAQFHVSGLRRRGYKVLSLEEAVPQGSIGKVVESLHFWMADEYRQALGRDIKRGLQYIATNYRGYPAGNYPTGYRPEKELIGTKRDGRPRYVNRLVVDPDTYILVRRAFTMRAEGRSIKEIHEAVHLYKRTSSYSVMFRNEIYVGRLVWGKMSINEFCTSIVDVNIWEKVQEINHKAPYHPRRMTSKYLLTGLLHCSRCGGWMNGRTSGKNQYYRCRNAQLLEPRCGARKLLPKGKLEGKAMKALGEYLNDPVMMTELYDEMCRVAQEKKDSDDVGHIQSKLKEMEREIRNITGAIGESGYSEALLARLAELEKEKGELGKRLTMQGESRHVVITGTVEEFTQHWSELWKKISLSEDREIQLFLRSMVERVDVTIDDEGYMGRMKLTNGKEIEL